MEFRIEFNNKITATLVIEMDGHFATDTYWIDMDDDFTPLSRAVKVMEEMIIFDIVEGYNHNGTQDIIIYKNDLDFGPEYSCTWADYYSPEEYGIKVSQYHLDITRVDTEEE